jgi:hypothetical protein
LAVAIGFLVLKGYTYGLSDQAEHLPQVLRMAHPELYAGDPFVDAATAHFTVRHWYVWLMFGMNHLMPLPWAAFVLTVLSITLLCWSVLRMAELVNGDRISPLLAPILALTVFYGCTVGLNHITYTSFISSTPAKALGALGLLLWLRQRWAWAGAVLGLAALFQVLVGLQLVAVLVAVSVLTGQWRSAMRMAGAFALGSAPMLGPVLWRQFGPEGMATDMDAYFRILFDFRNPHHYLPWHFPMAHYFLFGLMAIGTLLSLRARPTAWSQRMALMIMVICGGMLFYSILMATPQGIGIGRLQWFKSTIWVTVLGSLAISGLWADVLRRAEGVVRFARPVSMAVAITGLVFMLVAPHTGIAKLNHRYMVDGTDRTDLGAMHRWIAANTPSDAMFLIPPDDSGFALQAQRPHFVGWQAIIHEPYFMLPWYDRFVSAYGVTVNEIGEGDILALAKDGYCARYGQGKALPVSYRLDNLGYCAFADLLGPIVHREGDWVLSAYVPHLARPSDQ